MLNKEIIEWGCELLDGFEYRYLDVMKEAVLVDDLKYIYPITNELVNSQAYQLLLQKIIEGINKKNLYIIQMNQWVIEVYEHTYELLKQFDFNEDYKTIDEAKEKVIEYIYQEINK